MVLHLVNTGILQAIAGHYPLLDISFFHFPLLKPFHFYILPIFDLATTPHQHTMGEPSRPFQPLPEEQPLPSFTFGSSTAGSTAPSTDIEPDTFTDDEGYAASTSTSYVTSLASDIRRGVEENGRIYAAYGIHKPWMPVDESEVSQYRYKCGQRVAMVKSTTVS